MSFFKLMLSLMGARISSSQEEDAIIYPSWRPVAGTADVECIA